MKFCKNCNRYINDIEIEYINDVEYNNLYMPVKIQGDIMYHNKCGFILGIDLKSNSDNCKGHKS